MHSPGYEIKQDEDPAISFVKAASHVSTKETERDFKVSSRRVQQIIKQYRGTGLGPVLGERVGRPAKPYDEPEAENRPCSLRLLSLQSADVVDRFLQMAGMLFIARRRIPSDPDRQILISHCHLL